jgi:hypothetical protein
MNEPIPPYLTKPYSSARERSYATVVILRYWQLIEQLRKLVDFQPDNWPAGLKSLFPPSVPDGPPEHPQQRLERWFAVYGDEIRILQKIRDQLAHAVDVSDVDLRGADYVARVILAALFGMLPSRVNEDWAITKINAISRAVAV